MTYGVLPALVCGPVVGVVLRDVGVDAGEGELFVPGLRDRLHDQLGVRERRLRVILLQGKCEVRDDRGRSWCSKLGQVDKPGGYEGGQDEN